MNKEELKKLKRDLEKNCITLTKFLINYCGIYHKDIYDIKISHQDLKKLMPELKRVSFESLLDDRYSFYIGDIIPVKDCYGNVVPYENPMLQFEDAVEIDCEKVKEDEELDSIIIDENLSDYELRKLCKYFKEHNMQREYRKVRKLLKKEKKYKVKQYKRTRYDMRKGMTEYEEY